MSKIFGSGDVRYEYVDGWPDIPGQIELVECPGVAVDSQDRVYLFTIGPEPIVIFNKDGHYLNTIGEGMFSEARTHGLYIANYDSNLVADDGIHTIQKISPSGEKLMEIGQRNKPKPIWGGDPFNTGQLLRPSGLIMVTYTCQMGMAMLGFTFSMLTGIINFPGAVLE